ncbi:MAG: XdhC family protein [Desulfarculaceae bacterium]|nr:XdhC family protein [Desulfarculaceae bacterium]MCF8072786.1 XdhC family protein [Desulfarculaceae bacterium]MCF8100954.1 XdhC family protein [Desulfarculaceae bacterium]MCF8117562.1 XdhC family protein [Desulfarculaceae bacterium]
MREFLAAVHEHLAMGTDLCLATIIESKGSAPRSRGSQFFVFESGFHGTIGGGRFEADVIAEARQCMAEAQARMMHHRLMGQDVADMEMICGGNLDVYLEPLRAADQEAQAIYRTAASAAARGRRSLLATLVAPGSMPAVAGRKLLLSQDGGSVGSLEPGGGLVEALGRELARMSGASGPHIWPGDGAQILPAQVLVEPIINRPVVYIFGGGHVSQKLAPLVSMAGFGLVVADDRPEWANRQRFPQADEIWNQPLEAVLEGRELGPDAYVVIVTRGHLFDKEVLGQALKQNAAYVGMIGSRRKRDMIYRALSEQGVAPEVLDGVHSPIGLDIGAETPEEIAISIIAELVAIRAGKAAGQ